MGILATPMVQNWALILLQTHGEAAAKSQHAIDSSANGWLAFAGVIAGGAVTKLIDRYFAMRQKRSEVEDARRKELTAEETGFRAELRQQIQDLRKELTEATEHIGDLQKLVDEWRDKYYQNVAENLALNQRYVTIEAEYKELNKQNVELTGKYDALEGLQEKYDALQERFDELVRRVKAAGVTIE